LTTSSHLWRLVVVNQRDIISTSTDAGAAAVARLTLTVFRLNGTLLHWGDRLVEPLGLTSARWQMLGAIALAGAPLTAPQMGEAMGVTRQGAQKQLNLLLEQGLVEVRPNPAHRRSPLYALTPQGMALYRQADAMWTARATDLAASIPAAQARAATRTLESMLSQLQAASACSEIEP
jgi:DNA-binding MarR family transcriptional regulator